MQLEPVDFADLPGWAGDDHVSALGCFLNSAGVLGATMPEANGAIAGARAPGAGSRASNARTFFETWFEPHRIVHAGEGFVTGYYEPVLAGSRRRYGEFTIPLYRRPPDLVTVVDDLLRGTSGSSPTHLRRTAGGDVPFPTRAEIEQGALAGLGLELCWLADPVDAFFLHVQGSGIVEFGDGDRIRVGYDGKNGHAYTSVGKVLIARGEIAAEAMSLAALRQWLTADRERARSALWCNASFIFFRASEYSPGSGPRGVRDIELTAGRSLAVDAARHCIGLPVYVSAGTLTHAGDAHGFHRLMIAQDVGSAITGPERGDIFFGSGSDAGLIAGETKHAARFHVLLPRTMVAS